MNIPEFKNNSFVLYQILPDHKKIYFLNKALTTSNLDRLTDRIYKSHFKQSFIENKNENIPILSFITRDGSKVNVFFHTDVVHINSNRLKPIHDLVNAAMTDGNILLFAPEYKKNKENRDKYHLRYYRVYKRITPNNKPLPPICFS